MTAAEALAAWAAAVATVSTLRRSLAALRKACERYEPPESADFASGYPGHAGDPCCFATKGLSRSEFCDACSESWGVHRSLRKAVEAERQARSRALRAGHRLNRAASSPTGSTTPPPTPPRHTRPPTSS